MITVEGKTIKQIAEETGLNADTLYKRYRKGYTSYNELIQEPHKGRSFSEEGKIKNHTLSMYAAGQRMMQHILSKNINICDLADKTGISRSTICEFIYNGRDITSARLMKLCAITRISADYILGLKGGG